LGTAGLFMFQGAQFIAVATVVVYAGAILVTFLFVLMLAQPEGRAAYDRTSWESLVSAVTGAVIVTVLSMTLTGMLTAGADAPLPSAAASEELSDGVLTQAHTARIGAELFGRHLIAVEVAGVLLLVALVGATAMVGHSRGPLAEEDDKTEGTSDQSTI
jgi:NADH-quinone oxidoreductase subunit J